MTGTRPLAIDHGGETGLDPLGVVHLPDHRCLVVADLHLEKGSAFARSSAPSCRPTTPPARSAASTGRSSATGRASSSASATPSTTPPVLAASIPTPAKRSPPSPGAGAGSGCAATTIRRRRPGSTARRSMPPISAGSI
ncbi:MAG: hypothetical protein R3D25_02975 [Geminicoccaceae bacterium]